MMDCPALNSGIPVDAPTPEQICDALDDDMRVLPTGEVYVGAHRALGRWGVLDALRLVATIGLADVSTDDLADVTTRLQAAACLSAMDRRYHDAQR